MRLVEIDGNLVEVHVRRSPRARYVRAVYRQGAPPELVVPAGASERAVDRALHAHRDWIGRQLARAPRPRLLLPPVTEREGRRVARTTINACARREAARLGLTYRAIAIRDQRTRWGSCSSRGTLSFNWRLVLAPRRILEYVVVHELCHLREQNHSRRFWRLVEEAWPAFEEDERWLREHGWELLAYRPAA